MAADDGEMARLYNVGAKLVGREPAVVADQLTRLSPILIDLYRPRKLVPPPGRSAQTPGGVLLWNAAAVKRFGRHLASEKSGRRQARQCRLTPLLARAHPSPVLLNLDNY